MWAEDPVPGPIPLEHPLSLESGCPAYAARNASISSEFFFQEWISEIKAKTAKGNAGSFYFWIPYGSLSEVTEVTRLVILSR
jgi:hypothetical protein